MEQHFLDKMEQMDKQEEERELWPVACLWRTSEGHAWYNCDECGEDMPSRDWFKHTKNKHHRGAD